MNRSHVCLLSVLALSLSLGACANCEKKEKDEKNEVAVSMNELPAAVRATLERESAGGTVSEVEKEMKDGKTIYSADMEIHGQKWDIAVAEDGRVISKEKEEDNEKESDKEEKKHGG